MVYVRSASAQKLVDAAHTKLLVYYHDGNKRTQWGRNGINGQRVAADPYGIEIRRHHKYVARHAGSIKYAAIYRKSGEEVANWDHREGYWRAAV